MSKPPASLKTAFLARAGNRWAQAEPALRLNILNALSDLFDEFHQRGLADPHCAQRLAKGSDLEHLQRVAEMLLAKHLWDHGFSLTSGRAGPDFRASKDGYSVWVELVTPEPKGIDPAWLGPSHQEGVWTYPHEAIALRYTSALKEKHEKLVGRDGNKPGYLTQGIVRQGEPYVIAINQHLLHGRCPSLGGISQVPVAGEVVYAIGPQQLHLSAATGRLFMPTTPIGPSCKRSSLRADAWVCPQTASSTLPTIRFRRYGHWTCRKPPSLHPRRSVLPMSTWPPRSTTSGPPTGSLRTFFHRRKIGLERSLRPL